MKTVIYSKENAESVKQVESWRKRYPKFTFVEVSEKEKIEAISNPAFVVYLDKVEEVEETPVFEVEETPKAPKAKKPKKEKAPKAPK